MPNLLGVLETVLYVDAFERACPFYEQVLGLNSIYRDTRLCAYDVGARGVLLLFLRGHWCCPNSDHLGHSVLSLRTLRPE